MSNIEKTIGELLATVQILCKQVTVLSEKIDKVLPQISVLEKEIEEQRKIVDCHSQEIKKLMIWGTVLLILVGGSQFLGKFL